MTSPKLASRERLLSTSGGVLGPFRERQPTLQVFVMCLHFRASGLHHTLQGKRDVEPAVQLHSEKELPLLRSENWGTNAGWSREEVIL
jgi:hypothetical protein